MILISWLFLFDIVKFNKGRETVAFIDLVAPQHIFLNPSHPLSLLAQGIKIPTLF